MVGTLNNNCKENLQAKKRKKRWYLSDIILLISACLIASAAILGMMRLYADYKKGQRIYNEIKETFLIINQTDYDPFFSDPADEKDFRGNDETDKENNIVNVENTEQTLYPHIEWDKLMETNRDTAGWIYIPAVPEISYPIVQGETNEYYNNHTFTGEAAKCGAIYLSTYANKDFSSPHSLIYGHNMRDGTMFSHLHNLRNKEVYDSAPYFWILTKEKAYKYLIFSIFETSRDSDVFQIWNNWDPSFVEWEEAMQRRSLFPIQNTINEKSRIVTLVTCVPDSFNRTVVLGIAWED